MKAPLPFASRSCWFGSEAMRRYRLALDAVPETETCPLKSGRVLSKRRPPTATVESPIARLQLVIMVESSNFTFTIRRCELRSRRMSASAAILVARIVRARTGRWRTGLETHGGRQPAPPAATHAIGQLKSGQDLTAAFDDGPSLKFHIVLHGLDAGDAARNLDGFVD